MPKNKENKNPPGKAVKKRQSAGKGGCRKTTSKAAAQPAPPPKEAVEKQTIIQRLVHRLKAVIFKKKYPQRDEFRYNNKTDHPNWVFEEANGKRRAFGITHKEETFGKKNMPLKDNPNKKDPQPAFIRNGVITENSDDFSENLIRNLQFSKEDQAKVKSKRRNYIKRRKKHKQKPQKATKKSR